MGLKSERENDLTAREAMKKVKTFFLISILAVSYSAAGDRRFQAGLAVGWSHVYEYGTTEQYAIDSNDFPVMPAHSSACFGVAFQYLVFQRLGFAFEGLYYFSSPITLVDPSDQDTVKISVAEHYSAAVGLKFYFLRGEKIGAYLIAGGGIDKISKKSREYTSAYGYMVELTAPPKSVDPFAEAGIGFEYNLNPSLGLRVDLRYRIISVASDRIKVFNAMTGIFIRF
jgi:outer membrane protein W